MNDFKHFRGRGRGQYQHNNFRGGNFNNNRRGNPNNFPQMLRPPHFRDNNNHRWQRPQHSGWRMRHPPPFLRTPGGFGPPQGSLQGPPQNTLQGPPQFFPPTYSYRPPVPARPASPLPGSEEAREKAIAEASARIKQQLNLETEKPDNLVQSASNLQHEQILAPIATSFNDDIFSRFETDFSIDTNCSTVSEAPKQEKNFKRKVKKDSISSRSVEELRNKILNQFTTMSKGKIQSLVNNPGSSKYDNYLHHLVRDMRLHLSTELRNMYNNRESDSSMIDHFNSIVPDLGVELVNLPDTMVAELSKILQVDVIEEQGSIESLVDQNCFVNSPTDDNILIEPEDMFKQAEKLLLNTDFLESNFEICDNDPQPSENSLQNIEDNFSPDSTANFLQNNLENIQSDPFINRTPLCNEPPPNMTFIPEPNNLTSFSIPQGSFTPENSFDTCQSNFLNQPSNFSDLNTQISDFSQTNQLNCDYNVPSTTHIDYTPLHSNNSIIQSTNITPMIDVDLLETTDMDIDDIIDENLAAGQINLNEIQPTEQDSQSNLNEIPLPESNEFQIVLKTPICSRDSSPFSKKLLEVNLLPDSTIIEPNFESRTSQNSHSPLFSTRSETNDTVKSLTGPSISRSTSPLNEDPAKDVEKIAAKFDFKSVWVFKPKDTKINVTSFLDDVTSQNKCDSTNNDNNVNKVLTTSKSQEEIKINKSAVKPKIKLNLPKNLGKEESSIKQNKSELKVKNQNELQIEDMSAIQKRLTLDERIKMMMKMQEDKEKKGQEQHKSKPESSLLENQQQLQPTLQCIQHQSQHNREKLQEDNIQPTKSKNQRKRERKKLRLLETLKHEENKIKVKVHVETHKEEKKYLNKFQEKISKMTPDLKPDSCKSDLQISQNSNSDIVIKQEIIDSDEKDNRSSNTNNINIFTKNISSSNIRQNQNVHCSTIPADNVVVKLEKAMPPTQILEVKRTIMPTKAALKDLPPLVLEKSDMNITTKVIQQNIEIIEKNKDFTENANIPRKVEYRDIPGLRIKRKEKPVEKEINKNEQTSDVEADVAENIIEENVTENIIEKIERKGDIVDYDSSIASVNLLETNKFEILDEKQPEQVTIEEVNDIDEQPKILKEDIRSTSVAIIEKHENEQNIEELSTPSIVFNIVENMPIENKHQTGQEEKTNTFRKENAIQNKINEKISKKFDNIFKEILVQNENKQHNIEKSIKYEQNAQDNENDENKNQKMIENKILEKQKPENKVLLDTFKNIPESTLKTMEGNEIIIGKNSKEIDNNEFENEANDKIEIVTEDIENKQNCNKNNTNEIDKTTENTPLEQSNETNQSIEEIKNICVAKVDQTSLEVETNVSRSQVENNLNIVIKEKELEKVKDTSKEVRKQKIDDDKKRGRSHEKDSKKSERSSLERSKDKDHKHDHKNDRQRHRSKEKDKHREKRENSVHKEREKSLSKEREKSDRHRSKTKESNKIISKSDKKSENSETKNLQETKSKIDENVKNMEELLKIATESKDLPGSKPEANRNKQETVTSESQKSNHSKIVQRLIEIDLEVQKLMSEKFNLYKQLNLLNFTFDCLNVHPPVLPAEEIGHEKNVKDAETNTEVEEVKRPKSTTPSESTTHSMEIDCETSRKNLRNKKDSKTLSAEKIQSKNKIEKLIAEDSDVEMPKRLRKRKMTATPPNLIEHEPEEDLEIPVKKKRKQDKKSETKKSAKLTNEDLKINLVIENSQTNKKFWESSERKSENDKSEKIIKTSKRLESKVGMENKNKKNRYKSNKRRKKSNLHALSKDMIDEPNKKFFVKIKKPEKKIFNRNLTEIEENSESEEDVVAQISLPVLERAEKNSDEFVVQTKRVKNKKSRRKLKEGSKMEEIPETVENMDVKISLPVLENEEKKTVESIVQKEQVKSKKSRRNPKEKYKPEDKMNCNTKIEEATKCNREELLDKRGNRSQEKVEKSEENLNNNNENKIDYKVKHAESDNKIKLKIIKSDLKVSDIAKSEENEDKITNIRRLRRQTIEDSKAEEENLPHCSDIHTVPVASITKSKNSKKRRKIGEETGRSRSRSASKESELKNSTKNDDSSDENEILADKKRRKTSVIEVIPLEDENVGKKIIARRKEDVSPTPENENQEEKIFSSTVDTNNEEDKSLVIQNENMEEDNLIVIENKPVCGDFIKHCFVKLERLDINKDMSETSEEISENEHIDNDENLEDNEEIKIEISRISSVTDIEVKLSPNVRNDTVGDTSNEEEDFIGYDISDKSTKIGKIEMSTAKNNNVDKTVEITQLIEKEEGKQEQSTEDIDSKPDTESKKQEEIVEKIENSKLKEGIYCSGHLKSILDIKVIGNEFLAASEDGTIYKFSLTTGDLQDAYTGHKRAVTCINTISGTVLDTNAILMFSGSLDCTLKCFNVDTAEVLDSVKVEQAIQCMDTAWGFIFLGTYEGLLFIYNIKKKKLNDQSLTIANATVLMIKATTEGSRQVLILASRKREIMVRDAFTGLLLRTMCQDQKPTIYSLLLDKSRVYCGTSDKGILVLDFNNGTQTDQYNAGKGVVCVVMYKTLLFAGCYDGLIYIYNTNTNKHIITISGPGEGMLLSLAIHDGLIIAGTKKDHLLKIWRIPQEILNQIE